MTERSSLVLTGIEDVKLQANSTIKTSSGTLEEIHQIQRDYHPDSGSIQKLNRGDQNKPAQVIS